MKKIVKKKVYSRREGFTLLEIMAVVALIGLIMAIIMPNYLRARVRAAQRACISNQKIIYTAATMYQIRQEDSLEDMTDDERLDALIDREYIRGDRWCECPANRDGVYDYTMDFEGSILEDIDCTANPTEHQWP